MTEEMLLMFRWNLLSIFREKTEPAEQKLGAKVYKTYMKARRYWNQGGLRRHSFGMLIHGLNQQIPDDRYFCAVNVKLANRFSVGVIQT